MAEARQGLSTLVVTVDPAWPPISGADLRNWRSIAAAARLGPVTALSLVPAAGAPEPPPGIRLAALAEVTAADIHRRPPGGTAIDVSLPTGWQAALDRLLALGSFDAVVIEHLGLWPLLGHPGLRGIRRILDLHNVESALLAMTEPRWRRLLGLDARVRALRAVERRAVDAADEVWVCSTVDAARLRRLHAPQTPIRVVPNAVPATWQEDGASERPRNAAGPNLLYVGHLGYRPNVRAAEMLAGSILPRLRRRLPGATLTLAGRNPHRRVRALAGEGVTLVADPLSLAPLYRDADIAAIPLRIGGGTRIKVIEAMAAGLPVVATALAVEGLGLKPGQHFRLAEPAQAFVDEIERLWSDTVLELAQRQQARAFVLEHFGVEAVDARIRAGLAPHRES